MKKLERRIEKLRQDNHTMLIDLINDYEDFRSIKLKLSDCKNHLRLSDILEIIKDTKEICNVAIMTLKHYTRRKRVI